MSDSIKLSSVAINCHNDQGKTNVTTVSSTAASEEVPQSLDPRRWRVLVLLCGLQFMVLLDLTVVNVALPKIQEELGFSASGLTWVSTPTCWQPADC